ncbi:lecithin retinol acyltransferase family protein [Janthinobacterium lividum]|uniref:lecithin retinol acyltransferase family protein n=1 Tax=Janthinobacterium lividum TaxID=29581 RepID=UPI0009BF977E|nr:lecithin retinol acyltransferase family protein [Janthinobacterium lividum]
MMKLPILNMLAMTNSSNSARSSYAYGKPQYFTDAGYELKVGDHLIVSRTLYTHHGIYVGEGIVVHYSGLSDGLTSGPVVFDTLETFSGGREITVRGYSAASFQGKEVVRRAESRLGEKEYDFHSNNCEDFCSWAITGESRSAQVDFVEKVVGCFLPGVTLAATLRKHFSRKKFASSDSINDSAPSENSGSGLATGMAVTAAVVACLPVSTPILVAAQAYRWFRK